MVTWNSFLLYKMSILVDRFLFSCIVRINLSFLFPVLEFYNDKAPQIAVGIQPSIGICKIKQIILVIIFPLTMNYRNGNKIANNIICMILILN